MRCVIPGRSVKLFAKAIHCLSKIGCELYLEALSEGLALRTVSSSRSAYACFLFNESFFISYDDGSSDQPADSQEEDLFKCKIAMKSCLSAFKSMNTIEKTVDQCKIDLNVREARLVFLLYCRHGITKTYNLTFQECETLQAVFSKDLCPNFMTAQAKILNDAVYNFPNNQEEITLCVCPETFKVKNYVDDEPDPNRVIHTEMMLVPEEFDNYQIGVDTDVTFCLKELRAILIFAEFSSQPINVHFETSGKPIVFSMDGDPTYEADFVLATLVDHDSSTQSSQASVTAAASSQQPSTSKVSKDKQVNSSAKKNLPPQSEKTRQKTTGRLHNNTSESQNSQRSGHVNNNERDDSMFNDDDDDDLDITEIDQALLDGKHPVSSQKTEEKDDRIINHKDSVKTDPVLRSQSADANKSSVLDDFFGNSFPYQDLFTTGKRDLSVIPEASQENANTSARSARPIQTPPSSGTEVSFVKNVDMPSLGDSCVSPDGNSLKQSGKNKTRGHELDDSLMDVVADEDYDFIPGTPPHKKFKSMFFSASKSQGVSQDVVLAADSDED
ncbi:cell cycle checkpoint control protein RAD9B-like isoform X4 [Orbicella faveolata]|uniref:cell cycle checkpoint control protein RAD9B-like isoform X3 n=1 Tax=Orbicella faveolata TaxID=48498 RepID=UPI0009E4FB77|nr:cell cycle checkpoint control protein RAD9B-like isoform X3 [Orbicella faveolata]XP_020613644.1 cell cycle checkpoint control protein RAD9B-like isoform X4 [Orbicella faveolata]